LTPLLIVQDMFTRDFMIHINAISHPEGHEITTCHSDK